MQQNKKFRLVFVIWWGVWCSLHAYVLYSYFAVLQVAIVDSVITNVLTAGACMLIYNNMRYYFPKQEKFWYVLIVSAALSAICTGLATFFCIGYIRTTKAIQHCSRHHGLYGIVLFFY